MTGRPVDARAFARQWAEAWNRGDVEAVLDHFHDDVVFTSPLARRLDYGDGGIVRGKAALREYWNDALSRAAGLHFTLTAVQTGIDLIVIGFRTDKGLDRVEVLRFRDGLVSEGHGTFAEGE